MPFQVHHDVLRADVTVHHVERSALVVGQMVNGVQSTRDVDSDLQDQPWRSRSPRSWARSASTTRSSPSMYSMTRYGTPLASPKSSTRTTLLCFMSAATRASSSKRRTNLAVLCKVAQHLLDDHSAGEAADPLLLSEPNLGHTASPEQFDDIEAIRE